MNASVRAGLACCLFLWINVASAADENASSGVKELLLRKCVACHHGDDAKGKLDLTSREGLLAGGATGPAITPVMPGKSLLWQRIQQDEMPPKHPLSADEKRIFSEWIIAGCPWPDGALDPSAISTGQRAGRDWWSLQSLRRVDIPQARTRAGQRQPIDDFVLDKLNSAGLSLSPEAERHALMRRLSFDLTGLPPTPDEVEQFEIEGRPDAYERLVDRLLASPHYGERWARHWLDVVRFAESNGYERDLPRPNAWPYRDWIVEALNRDLPYDDFARWQLAGDVLSPDDPAAIRAVGFLVAGPHDTVVPVVARMRAMMRQDELEEVVGTVSQTFLGLTVNCARCHDHKFDPITTREYYQLAAVFAGVDHGEREVYSPEVRRQLSAWQLRIDELSARQGNEGNPDGNPPDQDDPTSKKSAADNRIEQQEGQEIDDLQRKHTELTKNGLTRVYTAVVTQPSPMKVHFRGNVASLGDEVSPAGLGAVQGLPSDFGLRPDAIESHRRWQLANWIADVRNPLFSRVMTNRVWHYHFGAGLVESPNDLGFHAGIPSHPELLDWLAAEFASIHRRVKSSTAEVLPVDAGAFSIKRLHRLLVTSATYRQSSAMNLAAAKIDSSNRLIWRMTPHRLEAEAVRDAMLAVAGELNTEIGGKGYADVISHFYKGTQFYDPVDPVGHVNHRRTLYRMGARGGRSPFLDIFDCPDPSTTTPRRSSTATPLQALLMLNHPFSLRMADRFADRLMREATTSVEDQVRLAYRLLYSRSPDQEELELSLGFVTRRGLPEFCRSMWNSSEFLFLD